MTTSMINDYILVPRASVSASTSSSETQKQPASTSSTNSKSASVLSSSSITTSAVSSVLSKIPWKGDHAFKTTLCAFYDDAVPNAAVLDYKSNLYVDLCSEFASFASLYEQYQVNAIRLETWLGNITPMQNSAANLTGHAVAENVSRSPYAAMPTMLKLLDQPGAHFLDYGFHKNHFALTFKPQGCYVPDTGSSPDNFIHSSGFQETSCASKHIWGCWLQQSSQALTTVSGRYITRRMTFTITFRRRRQT